MRQFIIAWFIVMVWPPLHPPSMLPIDAKKGKNGYYASVPIRIRGTAKNKS